MLISSFTDVTSTLFTVEIESFCMTNRFNILIGQLFD